MRRIADVIIMRHGEKENRDPKPVPGDETDKNLVHLTEEGKQKIRAIGKELLLPNNYEEIAVTTSDFIRTRETADNLLIGGGHLNSGDIELYDPWVSYIVDREIGMNPKTDMKGGGILKYGEGEVLDKYVHDLIKNFYFRQRDGNPNNLPEMQFYSHALLNDFSRSIERMDKCLTCAAESDPHDDRYLGGKGLILMVSHGGPMDPGVQTLGQNLEFHIEGDKGFVEWKTDGYKGIAHQTAEFAKGEVEYTGNGNIGIRLNVRGKEVEYGFDALMKMISDTENHSRIYQK